MVGELTGHEPELQTGDSGEGVMLLQVRLYGLGIYRDFPDATFNMTTENAVRELQSTLGQDNDGMVTRETWQAIHTLEQRYGIQYQYTNPYDALAQIRYDLEHPSDASGQYPVQEGQWSEDGKWRYDGAKWQPVGGGGQHGAGAYAGHLSDDGHWRWDGYTWHPAHGGAGQQYAAEYQQAGYSGYSDQHSGYSDQHGAGGHLSDDGKWRWDGHSWHPAEAHTQAYASAQSHVGQLSADGRWRWDGNDWHAA